MFLARRLLEDHEKAGFHLADEYECADAQYRRQDGSACVELGANGVHRLAMAESGAFRDGPKCSGAASAEAVFWRDKLAALEVETLEVEREHDALRASAGFAFAREAQEDRDLVNRTVQERAEFAEA